MVVFIPFMGKVGVVVVGVGWLVKSGMDRMRAGTGQGRMDLVGGSRDRLVMASLR